jgi:hypothetical protein
MHLSSNGKDLMPAKDLYHDTVKTALIKDGWTITHDPYRLRYGVADIYIDLAAERAIAAEKEGRKIAVEVKNFASGSIISEFHVALGQFLNYSIALETSEEPDRHLYLAVPGDVYHTFLQFDPAATAIHRYRVSLLIYNPTQEVIEQWKD